jgi:hypothetical protein
MLHKSLRFRFLRVNCISVPKLFGEAHLKPESARTRVSYQNTKKPTSKTRNPSKIFAFSQSLVKTPKVKIRVMHQ